MTAVAYIIKLAQRLQPLLDSVTVILTYPLVTKRGLLIRDGTSPDDLRRVVGKSLEASLKRVSSRYGRVSSQVSSPYHQVSSQVPSRCRQVASQVSSPCYKFQVPAASLKSLLQVASQIARR
jgi:hypothetical protein